MAILIESVTSNENKYKICESILNGLPLWFGLAESNKEYCEGVKEKPFFHVKNNDQSIGFASIKRNNEDVLEIYVMGINEKYHNIGIGKRLIKEIIEYGVINKYKYLEVKTLDESRESDEYRKTRLFYKRVGFIPFDVLYNEWGEDNPCLIMIMNIENKYEYK